MAIHTCWPHMPEHIACNARLLVELHVMFTVDLQVLVTSNDFTDPHFKNNLCATVEDLLSMNVVPVFNENDAISKGAVQTKASSCHYAFLSEIQLCNGCGNYCGLPGPRLHNTAQATCR